MISENELKWHAKELPAFPSRLLSDSPSCKENDSIQLRKNEVCINFYYSILITCSNTLVISMYFKSSLDVTFRWPSLLQSSSV